MTNLSLETPAAAAVPQMQPTEHPDKPQAHHHAQEPASKTPGLPFDVLRQPRNDGGRKRRRTNDDEGAPCSPLGRLGRRRRRASRSRSTCLSTKSASPGSLRSCRSSRSDEFGLSLPDGPADPGPIPKPQNDDGAGLSDLRRFVCGRVGKTLGGPALGPRLRPRRSVGAVQPRFAAPSSKAPRPSSPPPSSPSSSSSSFALHPVTVSTRSFKEKTVMKKADTGKAR